MVVIKKLPHGTDREPLMYIELKVKGFESRRKSKAKTNVPNDDVKGSLRSHLDKCVIKKLPYRELLKQPDQS